MSNQVPGLRLNLRYDIESNKDTKLSLSNLMNSRCPHGLKYKVIEVDKIIRENGQSPHGLKMIPVAVNILEKYGKHLLKSSETRASSWRSVKFTNPIFKGRVDILKGGRDIMKLLGYTVVEEDGVSYPPDTEPEKEEILDVLADLLLLKKEIEAFFGNVHPDPSWIQELSNYKPEGITTSNSNNDVGPIQNKTLNVNQSSEKEEEETLEKQSSDSRTPDMSDVLDTSTDVNCDICGDQMATFTCKICDNKLLCEGCDVKWHKHPKRQNHQRFKLGTGTEIPATSLASGHDAVQTHPSTGPNQLEQQGKTPMQMSPLQMKHELTGIQLPMDTAINQNIQQQGAFIQDNTSPSSYSVETGTPIQYPMDRNVHQTQPNQSPLQMQGPFHFHHVNPVYPPQLQPVLPQSQGQPIYPNVYMPYDAQGRQAVSYQNVPSSQGAGRDLLPQLIPDSNISDIGDTRVKQGQHPLHTYPNTQFSDYIAYPPQTVQANVPGSIHQQQGLTLGRPQNTEALIGYGDKQMSNIMSHHEIEKRKSKLDLKISTLVEEIAEIDENITSIIHSNQEFYTDPDYITFNKRKGKYMREKRELENELQKLNNWKLDDNSMKQSNAIKSNLQTPMSNQVGQIFYPPSLSTLFPSNQSTPYGVDHTNRNSTYYSPNFSQQYIEQTDQRYRDLTNVNYSPFVQQSQAFPHADVSQISRTVQTKDAKSKNAHVPEIKTPQAPFQLQPVDHKLTEVGNASKISGPIEMYSQSEILTHPTEVNKIKELSEFDVINATKRLEFAQKQSKHEDKKMKLGNEKLPLDLGLPLEDTGRDFLIVGPPSPPTLDPPSSSDRLLPSHHNTQQWQCQHCTYINEPGPRICVICNKTSDNPAVLDSLPPEDIKPFQINDRQEQLELFEQKISAEQDRVYQEKQEAQRSFEEDLKKKKLKENTNKSLDKCLTEESSQLKLSSEFLRPEARGSPPQSSKPKSDEYKNKSATENREPSPVSLNNNSASSSMYSSGLSPQTSGDIAFQKIDLGKALDHITEKRRIEKMSIDGRDTVNMLKNADKDGIDIDDMAIAVRNGDMENIDPLRWFREKWLNMIDSVLTRVDLAGSDSDENEIGRLTVAEAKKALRASNGNVNEAVGACVERRKQLFAFLHGSGPFAREDILEVMYKCEGDEEESVTQLLMKYLNQFYERMWRNNVEGASPNLLYHPMTPDHCLSVSNSVVSHASFQAIVKNKDTPIERRIRMIIIEGKLQSWGRGETVIRILDNDIGDEDGQVECSLEDIVEAVRNCGDRDSSLIYLKQECQCCFCNYPMSKIRNFSTCQCKICADCVKQNFEVAIKDKHIRNWTCPICSQPNMEDEDVAEGYFSFLGLMLRTMLDQEVLDLYQTKLRDWHLQKDPNFRWCSHCGNGFLYNGRNLKMTCPSCHLHTCFKCKKMWEEQHTNLTCEQFEQWKIDNDPENQAIGLARHLEINGIDCPSCKMKYSLAKGGCMHFRCPQCGHEFCSGCSHAFFQKSMCTKYVACKNKGLHCHHPRDCFFYLRDNDVKDLQKLLTDYNVHFNREPPDAQEDKLHCPVLEQKEYDMGKKDESCGRDVEDGHAGVCVNHYKEYLVTLINKNKVDPVSIMSSDDMKILIQRKEKELPTLKPTEDSKSYKKRLLKFIKTSFPLRKDS